MTRPVRARLAQRARRTAAITLVAGGALAFGVGGAAQAATGVPDDQIFVMITSGPEQTVTDNGDVTLTFGYDLRPGVDRNGQDALLESYVVNASGEMTWFLSSSGSQWTTVEGPGAFADTISLPPGTYTRHIESSFVLHCDCHDMTEIAAPYSFTVPETTGPTPTPTVTPTATPTPDPTPTGTPLPTPEPTATAAPTPAPSDASQPASASLSSSTATPRSKLTVTGRGYAPGEAIELWLHSTPVKLWTGTAGADGTFSQSVVIPDSTTPGTHHIEVRGATSGVSSLRLTVLGGLAVTGMDASTTLAGGVAATLLLAAGIGLIALRRTSRA